MAAVVGVVGLDLLLLGDIGLLRMRKDEMFSAVPPNCPA